MLTDSLSQSIRHALRAGRQYGALLAVPALLAGLPVAVRAQDAAPASQKLETIEVTGSRIRRVDVETASPVLTVDRAAIEKSGKLTVGDLVQELPSISGNAVNPAMNNGGGSGGSFVSLRGLGTNRTLILVNGHRVVNADVNTIPTNLVERIEVLTDGASAVYGSDAIGGVVNFIMRSNYQGAELTTSYGISDRDDGKREAFNLTFGQTSDKGSIVGGIDYNKFDGILSGNRDFGKFALTLGKTPNSNGQGFPVTKGGSAASPSGFISAPQFANCPSAAAAGGPGGTFDPSAPGGGPDGIPAHYRCFSDATDTYNYQAINLIFTPQERTNAYLLGNYKLTDNVEAYMSVFHNKTTSEAQLAPLPLDLFSANITMQAGQPYNPFGVDVGLPNGGVNDLAIRLSAIGPRILHFTQTTDQVITGLKGTIGDTSWQWDGSLNYGHQSVLSTFFGSLATGDLAQSGSFSANCIPNSTAKGGCINIFDQTDPNTAAILKQYAAAPFVNTLNTFREADFNINGNLFDLPAGTVSLAGGGSYRKVYTNINVDYIAKASPESGGNCAVQISACATPFQGGFSVKEAYAEVLIPLVKDIPFIHSLNLDLGDRYSDYNTFGSTSNWKAALEYRPLEDLLLRGTVSKVFRAPNTAELFTGLTDSFDNYTQPTIPGTTTKVPGFGSKNGTQVQTFFAGSAVLGAPLLPEIGKSFDFGIVYDPHWIDGLSVSADVWRVYLDNNITRPTGQSIANFCAADATSPFCSDIVFGSGKIQRINTVIQNFGRLDTRGVDFGAKYRLPETAFGKFNVSLDATYTAQYDNQLTVKNSDGTTTTAVDHAAGTFDPQFGNIARWRGLSTIGWSYGSFSAAWTTRYINGEKVPLLGHVGAWAQNNVTVGYNIAPINTRIDIGIDNIADKQPTVYYANNVVNANVDVNTYDTIGRYYFARISVKF